MAVIKLNEGKMAKNKKPKPTTNDFVIVINSLIQDIHSLKNDMEVIMGAFDMFVEYKGDVEKFREFMETKLKVSDEVQETGQDNQVAVETDSQDKR
mgnify:CR=1 FL=1